jgi:hypothetical protein
MSDGLIQRVIQHSLFELYVVLYLEKESPKEKDQRDSIRKQESNCEDGNSKGDLVLEVEVPVIKLDQSFEQVLCASCSLYRFLNISIPKCASLDEGREDLDCCR